MTLLEEDLLASLKELLETSEVMNSGRNFSADELIRFQRAIEWAKRVIELAES
ncbi:MAG: hypothetical protein GJV46_16070 [Geobacter sp.]|nr:hypothetical protein [Geobacter sp.]